jgi:hypothetical protein
MNEILPLSTAGRMPLPALKPLVPLAPRGDTASDEQPASPTTAPYQARPVTGSTLISHNFTPALPVLDPDELSKEVRGWVSAAGSRALHRSITAPCCLRARPGGAEAGAPAGGSAF